MTKNIFFSAHFDVGGKCRVLVRALVLLTHDTIISRSVSVEASTQIIENHQHVEVKATTDRRGSVNAKKKPKQKVPNKAQ